MLQETLHESNVLYIEQLEDASAWKNFQDRTDVPIIGSGTMSLLEYFELRDRRRKCECTTLTRTRRVATLVAEGFDAASVGMMAQSLKEFGIKLRLLAPSPGVVGGLLTACSVLVAQMQMYDALYLPGGDDSVRRLRGEPDALDLVRAAWRHGKAICATGAGAILLADALGAVRSGDGSIVVGLAREQTAGAFLRAIAHQSRPPAISGGVTSAPRPRS